MKRVLAPAFLLRRSIFPKNVALWALASLLLISTTAAGQSRSAAGRGVDRERLAMIPARLKSYVERGAIAGAVTLVMRGGRVVSLEAVGYQDLESRKPMRADAIFDVRSVTKPVTAVGVMILVEEGRLALGDPVEKYLPEFRAARGAQDTPVTIRHLLTHTSGLPFNRPAEIENITVRRDRTLSEVVRLLSKQQPDFEPGTQFRYGTGGYAILGRVIEVVSGKPYEQFMAERVFAPLGMKDSSFFIPAGKQARVASLYRVREGRLERWREVEDYARRAKYPGPEFGMYTTASDLAALCQMMLDGGTYNGRRVLSRASVEAMTENYTLNVKSAVTGRPVYQGLGWALSGDPADDFPLTSPGSFGHNGTFGSFVWVDPQRKLVRIFLEHLFGSGNESDIFMAMAAAALTN